MGKSARRDRRARAQWVQERGDLSRKWISDGGIWGGLGHDGWLLAIAGWGKIGSVRDLPQTEYTI
jgi:hypothetical protein